MPEGARLTPPETMDESQPHSVRRKLVSVFIGVLAPVSIALVVGAVLVSEQAGPDAELQLIAPSGARPGDRIALRANLLVRLDQPDGPTLTTSPVDVMLIDASGRAAAQTRLTVSPAQSMEGTLMVPPTLAAGHYTLVAASRSANVHAPFVVGPDAPVAEAAPRNVALLAVLALGPFVPSQPMNPPPSGWSELPPASLDVRVVGGTCVPEVPCNVLVAVGSPPADVSLTTTPSVDPTPAPVVPLSQSDIVSFTARVHGPEAETELVVRRAGLELGRRGLRLPVALGELQLEVSPFGLVGSSPSVYVLGAARGRPIIIDVFTEGRWIYTHAFAGGALDVARTLPGFRFARAVPHRLQARTDIFDSSAAASRYMHVAQNAYDDPPLDPAVSPHSQLRDRGLMLREARFYFASLDAERLSTPVPVSGRDAATARAFVGRERVRVISIGALLLLAGLLAVLLLDRGLRASREARALLLEAGDIGAQSSANRRRDVLTVLAIVGAVLLALLGVLAFVLARFAAQVG